MGTSSSAEAMSTFGVISFTRILRNFASMKIGQSALSSGPIVGTYCYSNCVMHYCSSKPKIALPYFPIAHFGTIFTSTPADRLWEGVTGPAGKSKKRARGKRRVTRPRIDLHKGQRLGCGQAVMEWPGLNASLLASDSLRPINKGKTAESYFKRLEEIRNKSAVKKKRLKLPPLLRGWSGSRLGGQSVGPPSPGLMDFDTRIIEMKVVATMTATVGRYRRFSIVVATGNGRGLCGIGKAKALMLNAAIRRAKQRAIQNLVSFDLKDGRTLWHVGHVCEWKTKIFAMPAPEGAGLTCHRVLRTLCQIIGLKDMYAKVEGSTKNYQALARGFLRLLGNQESYQDIANRVGMHVVEFTADGNMYPRILASPACGHSIDPTQLKVQDSKAKNNAQTVSTNSDELPMLCISHPERHRPRKPKLEEHDSFLDDLVDIGEGRTVMSDVADLLASGERDLDALVLGGRVPLIKKTPLPGYLNNPGNLKKAAERYRYRNLEAAKRERQVYESLHSMEA